MKAFAYTKNPSVCEMAILEDVKIHLFTTKELLGHFDVLQQCIECVSDLSCLFDTRSSVKCFGLEAQHTIISVDT